MNGRDRPRDRVVDTADDWIGNDGEFIAHLWMLQLSKLVQERLSHGDYDQSEALFCVVERLIADGDDAVKEVILTGFVENMQHQKAVEPALWQPLLGNMAMAHCKAMDEFYGIKP